MAFEVLAKDSRGNSLALRPQEGLLYSQIPSAGDFDGQVRVLIGGTSAGDGGEGLIRWDINATDTADNLTVWGTRSGRWKRFSTGSVANVKWFGADSTGSTSSTDAINAALLTGLDVELPPGTYACAGLTQSTAYQSMRCTNGKAVLAKNANGKILTSTGLNFLMENVQFYGGYPTFTGDNCSFAGNGVQLINCSSNFAGGRAVLMTGDSNSILGTNGSYSTSATGVNSWDIEIGISGTPTLYHKIFGIATQQHEGGILLVETGGATILSSTFGKLTFNTGATSAGSGAGRVIGNRILGDINVNQSNGVFTANQFAAINITIGAGVGMNIFDASNNFSAITSFTNNGNANSLIMRETSTGSTNKLKFGPDSSIAILDIDTLDAIFKFPGQVTIKNNKNLAFLDALNATTIGAVNVNASDNMFFSYTGAGFLLISSGGTLQLSGTNGIVLDNHLRRDNDIGVVASTTQTQAAGIALALTGDIIHVVTCTNANDTIAIPTAVAGRYVTVINSGAQTLRIYPFTSDDLGAGVDISTTLVAGSSRRFFAVSTSLWVVA